MQVWTDYSTLGYSLLLSPEKMIAVEPDRVTIKGGETFGCIDCEVRAWHTDRFDLSVTALLLAGGHGGEPSTACKNCTIFLCSNPRRRLL
jgi:hypothetical protein